MNAPTVLYAEDDANDVFLMDRAFGKADFDHLHTVSDGQRALDYLSGTAPYDDRTTHPIPGLVLLDINMPYLSGLEVLAWIRAQPEYRTLPVVLFTSSAQEKDLRKAYATGATAYIVKPNNASTFVEIAKQLRALMLGESMTEADFSRLPGFQPPPSPGINVR